MIMTALYVYVAKLNAEVNPPWTRARRRAFSMPTFVV